MKSIVVKSALVLSIITALAGCKTITDAMESVNGALSDFNSSMNPAETVSADQICKEWKSNQSRANSAWVGKNIILSGTISGISESDVISKYSMVHLGVSKQVRASFVFNRTNDVMDLSSGQKVTLKGKLTSISYGLSNNCSFTLNNSFKVKI